ncbi:S9 family peptidase [Pseudonocardia dioxanivorans]|uniref:S9 family peptidase n=1 Tax=Pseudonocardia dioxanivorans TaxID=240495 RepID=UPI000CD16151|nr:prolyl oligopeptidase family serine peptidase [Pseudonocardia dioxanivorans]
MTLDPLVLTDDDYARAERMLAPYRARHVPRVDPQWLPGGRRFVYVSGGRTLLVEPAMGTRRDATDYEIAAAAPGRPDEIASPDGRWTAFASDGNLWVRSRDGEEVALTDDAEPGVTYATLPDPMAGRMALRGTGLDGLLVVHWSPDSTRLLTHRLDQRDVAEQVLVESSPAGGGRPVEHRLRYPVPGDEQIATATWTVLDVESRTAVRVQGEPQPVVHPADVVYPWWSGDHGEAVYHVRRSRDGRVLELVAIDPVTGAVRVLVREAGKRRVDPSAQLGDPPMARVLGTGEVLWWSQRDGWGHLFLHGADGAPVATLTSGQWSVRRVLWVDEERRQVWFVAAGLDVDPYVRQIARVALDGSGFTRLTDDGLDHDAVAPPEGGYLVDRASTVAIPPRSRVLDGDGEILVDLEAPDTAGLEADGWSPPERFEAVAADGITPIFGLLWRPYGFDPSRRYPIVDSVYPGPSNHRAGPAFDSLLPGLGEALAALGFAVVAVDGRGGEGRSRAFQDHSWGAIDQASSIDDHVAAIRELGRRHPWLDTDRVGITGHSAGGYATARALLAHPGFYSVGVATAGSHDLRVNVGMWTEHYHGPITDQSDVRAVSNTALAPNLVGRLLLVHGELDDNALPAQTMRLVDALIAADRDVDLLIVPGADHTFAGRGHHVVRRSWDYLVRHLHGTEPPRYRLSPLGA